MKTQNSILIATVAALAFALAPVTQAAIEPPPPTPFPGWGPVITIHSVGSTATGTADVLRGETGSFILHRSGFGFGVHVNFKVSGTAIPGVDYVALVSPAYIGSTGYAVLSVKTLPNLRASFNGQAYSVVVTLEPGPGYLLGTPRSAEMLIK
jgi:hypothetical protein